MKKIEITKEEYEKVKEFQKTNKNIKLDRKLQVIILRYKGFSNKEICEVTQYTERHAIKIIKDFKTKEFKEFVNIRYGGNHRSLTEEQEKEILEKFEKKAQKGQVVRAWDIKKEFDKVIGKDTGRGYIYMLLKRHGWRKIMPRSKHPNKASNEEIKSSKKLNPQQRSWKTITLIKE